MKKLISIITLCAVLCTSFAGALSVSAEDDIKVIVDSNAISFDQPPVIIEGRTLVPMRAIFEALGFDVNWEAASQKITASNKTTAAQNTEKTIIMNVNNVNMQVSEPKGAKTVTLDVPPQIISDRTLVPVRAISEAIGANVAWDGDTRTVTISSVEYLRNLVGNDGRRAGSTKGNMTIENQSIKLSVDKSKASTESDAVSFIEYDLGGRYSVFAAEISGTSNTYFRVFADGEKVYDSGKGFSKGGLPEKITVGINKCKTLRVEAYGIPGTPAGFIQMDSARVLG